MKPKWLTIAGFVLHVLIGGLMIFAGSGKVLGFAPPEVVEGLVKFGLKDQVFLIGSGELTSAILLLVPRTAPLGVLLTTGFWGGTICLHMSHGESYVFQSFLLLMTWVGGWLRGSIAILSESPKSSKPHS